ncbi:MAG: AAA family ATPase [Pseudomonadota bacterium]
MSSTEPAIRVVLSGCSGAGKSSLLAEMASRGWSVAPEAGRRVLEEGPRPWEDAPGFVRAATTLAAADYDAARPGVTVFDRGLVDLLAYLPFKGEPIPDDLADMAKRRRYADTVFWAEPWPAVFADDGSRGKTISDAAAEANALADVYDGLGYRRITLPQLSIAARADWLETRLRRLVQ